MARLVLLFHKASIEKAGTLSADEVYASTAYLLYLEGIIKENDIMDANSLPKVRMPHGPRLNK